MNVSTATTAELVEFFNAHSTKPVKKFADRKTAERRVAELIASMPAAHELTCPECGGKNDITVRDVEAIFGAKHDAADKVAFCHDCGHDWDVKTGKAVRKPAKTKKEAAAAIAASWKNKEVAARRATRHAVIVTNPKGHTDVFKSVREAFLTLNLPLGRHIKFRGELKVAGRHQIHGYTFAIVA